MRSLIHLEGKQQVHVVDVGVCRTGPNQRTELVEKGVTIVVGQVPLRAKSKLRSALECGSVDKSPGGVGRTVVAVGANAGQQHIRYPAQGECRGERQLLVTPAAARPTHRN